MKSIKPAINLYFFASSWSWWNYSASISVVSFSRVSPAWHCSHKLFSLGSLLKLLNNLIYHIFMNFGYRLERVSFKIIFDFHHCNFFHPLSNIWGVNKATFLQNMRSRPALHLRILFVHSFNVFINCPHFGFALFVQTVKP